MRFCKAFDKLFLAFYLHQVNNKFDNFDPFSFMGVISGLVILITLNLVQFLSGTSISEVLLIFSLFFSCVVVTLFCYFKFKYKKDFEHEMEKIRKYYTYQDSVYCFVFTISIIFLGPLSILLIK